MFADVHVTPDGRLISEAEWAQQESKWLPTDADRLYVHSLMGQCIEPGKFANWIAAPGRGINNQPVNFEYVRFN